MDLFPCAVNPKREREKEKHGVSDHELFCKSYVISNKVIFRHCVSKMQVCSSNELFYFVLVYLGRSSLQVLPFPSPPLTFTSN